MEKKKLKENNRPPVGGELVCCPNRTIRLSVNRSQMRALLGGRKAHRHQQPHGESFESVLSAPSPVGVEKLEKICSMLYRWLAGSTMRLRVEHVEASKLATKRFVCFVVCCPSPTCLFRSALPASRANAPWQRSG